jgi:hypothetical protein
MLPCISALHLFIVCKKNYNLIKFLASKIETARRVKVMKNRFKLMIIGLLCMMAFVGAVSASSIIPDGPYWTSPPDQCPDLGYAVFHLSVGEFIVPLEDGRYCDASVPQRCVNINYYVVDNSVPPVKIAESSSNGKAENAFDFYNANFDVDVVIVHGGSSGEYQYNYLTHGGAVRSDTLLTAPLNVNPTDPSKNKYPSLSFIDFCGGVATPEFPTIAVPVGAIIGIVGLVYVVRKREK